MLLYSLLHLTGYDLGARRAEAVPAVGLANAGASRVRPDAGCRGDDRAARPGLHQRRGHGHRRAAARRRVQPARPRDRGPPDVRASLSDGDLQEGIASEAASLAGHFRLGKLVVLYDDNHIQLDGPTAMAWSRGCPRAVRRLRLAHPAGRGRQRHGPRSTPRSSGPGRRPTVAHRRPDAHRLSAARTSRTPRRPTARRSARTRSA